MLRFAALALWSAACGRSQSVSDQELPGLVVEAHHAEPPIDFERAIRDPAELGRALARPYRVVLAALGPHNMAVNSATSVTEAGKTVSELSDHAQIENGEAGAYHAVYTNSADYGRETTFADGRLYLRPRYQRWHARDPEAPDEPQALRDQYFEATWAVWDLLAPGAELGDAGPIELSGRKGRKIEIKRSSDPSRPPAESVTQRGWREGRSVEAVAGEIVLDSDKAVPLAMKLTGTVGFSRDGRRFAMTISVDSAISGLGTASEIAAPADDDVVATPQRLREVDDRDYLLQGIAPPLRKNPDGTAVPPAPAQPAAGPAQPAAAPATAVPAAGSAASPTTTAKPKTKPRSNEPHRRARSEGSTP